MNGLVLNSTMIGGANKIGFFLFPAAYGYMTLTIERAESLIELVQ